VTFTNGFHLRIAIVFGFIGVFFLAAGIQAFQEGAAMGRAAVALAAGSVFFGCASWSATTLVRRFQRKR
jgi:hypothetical protein